MRDPVHLARANRLSHAKPRVNHQAKAPGQPKGWLKKDFLRAQAEAEREARRIFHIMKEQGLLPGTDDIADEALLAVLTMMRQPGPVKDKHSLARTLLEYTRSKPSTKTDVTVRTAEDFLDELSELDDAD